MQLSGIHFSSTVLEELLLRNEMRTTKSTTNAPRKASLPRSDESPAKKPPNSTQEQQASPAPKLKFYAIPIGPGETGTSTIQSDMVQNPFEENILSRDKDSVICVGLRNPAKEFRDPFAGEEIRRINGRSVTPTNRTRGAHT